MAGKAKIDFYGSVEILKKLDEAGVDIEKEIVNALRKSTEKPSEEMLSFIRGHKRSGRTEASWGEEITSKDGVITAEFGFSIRKGGIPALFFEVGTPRKAPPASWFISNALDHNLDEIITAQNEALMTAFKNLTN
jgi:hypothetical protein